MKCSVEFIEMKLCHRMPIDLWCNQISRISFICDTIRYEISFFIFGCQANEYLIQDSLETKDKVQLLNFSCADSSDSFSMANFKYACSLFAEFKYTYKYTKYEQYFRSTICMNEMFLEIHWFLSCKTNPFQ